MTRADQVRWLTALCDRLTPAYREVVQRRLAGQAFGQIATELETPIETVRKRFYRAYSELQRTIAARTDGES